MIVKWASQQGITIKTSSELHVTIAFSKSKVNWNDLGDPDTKEIMVPSIRLGSKEREIKSFGDITVLKFNSGELDKRFNYFISKGASWDHKSFEPHISFYYKKIPIDKINPYIGPIILGPETFTTIDLNWLSKIK